MASIALATGFGLLFSLLVLFLFKSSGSKGTREIPGPQESSSSLSPDAKAGLPLLGNVTQLPKTFPWYKYTAWCKEYGPLVKFTIGSQEHVIVNTEKIANDLMRERGNIYSSRPQIPMAAQLLSRNMRPVLLPYGAVWRNSRKLMHHFAMPASTKKYEPTQEEESVRVLHGLLQDGSRYDKWFDRYAAGLIIRLAFGETIITGDEEPVRRIHAVSDNLDRLLDPKRYLVNVFPVLLRLPTWLAPFKREAARLHAEELDLFTSLVKGVEKRISQGDPEAADTFTARWLEDKPTYGLTDDQAYYTLGTLFEAGAGTTAAAMKSFVLALVLHPASFEKLTTELDEVVGQTRMPNLEDLSNLPYMRACVKETLRWRPVTPTNVPHELIRDDIYDGYTLKKGTIIQVNQWGIHREPELYPNPEAFLPERWLETTYPTYQEPLSKFPNLQGFSAFGFGRRICPGLHIAESSMYLLASRMVWAFDIRAKPGVTYRDDDYTSTALSQPKWFDFNLVPKVGREAVIREVYACSSWSGR